VLDASDRNMQVDGSNLLVGYQSGEALGEIVVECSVGDDSAGLSPASVNRLAHQTVALCFPGVNPVGVEAVEVGALVVGAELAVVCGCLGDELVAGQWLWTGMYGGHWSLSSLVDAVNIGHWERGVNPP